MADKLPVVAGQTPHVIQNLTIDPNDPRKWPVVDGASVEPVDINVPIKGVKEAA